MVQRLGALVAVSALVVSCSDTPVEGGTAELEFEGGALDGSDDEALAALAPAPSSDGDAEPAVDPEVERLAEAYLTMPIDEILASMGLARDEETQMMDLHLSGTQAFLYALKMSL